jgi:hypothetical protein
MNNAIEINYSLFKDGLGMDEIRNMFYSYWESNTFQNDAVSKGLLEFTKGSKFIQIKNESNETVKSILVDSNTGSIIKINHE